MNAERRPRVWVAGASECAEFQGILERLIDLAEVRFAAHDDAAHSVASADGGGGADFEPEWVAWFSDRPESVARDTVERWQRRFPLARFVVVLGTWCEGETRTGRPWPGVSRVFWYEAPTRWLATLATADRADGAEDAEWRLPRTATEVERLLAATPCLADHPNDASNSVGTASAGEESGNGPRLAVFSATRVGWESLRDAAIVCGATACRWTVDSTDSLEPMSPASIDACVLDWDDSADAVEVPWRCDAWRKLGVPTLVLLGFPRFEDDAELRRLGAELLPKPWRLADFRRWLATVRARASTLPAASKRT